MAWPVQHTTTGIGASKICSAELEAGQTSVFLAAASPRMMERSNPADRNPFLPTIKAARSTDGDSECAGQGGQELLVEGVGLAVIDPDGSWMSSASCSRTTADSSVTARRFSGARAFAER